MLRKRRSPAKGPLGAGLPRQNHHRPSRFAKRLLSPSALEHRHDPSALTVQPAPNAPKAVRSVATVLVVRQQAPAGPSASCAPKALHAAKIVPSVRAVLGLRPPIVPAAQHPNGLARLHPIVPAAQHPNGLAAQHPNGLAAQRPIGLARLHPVGLARQRRVGLARLGPDVLVQWVQVDPKGLLLAKGMAIAKNAEATGSNAPCGRLAARTARNVRHDPSVLSRPSVLSVRLDVWVSNVPSARNAATAPSAVIARLAASARHQQAIVAPRSRPGLANVRPSSCGAAAPSKLCSRT